MAKSLKKLGINSLRKLKGNRLYKERSPSMNNKSFLTSQQKTSKLHLSRHGYQQIHPFA